jgi:hypothetical protein
LCVSQAHKHSPPLSLSLSHTPNEGESYWQTVQDDGSGDGGARLGAKPYSRRKGKEEKTKEVLIIFILTFFQKIRESFLQWY